MTEETRTLTADDEDVVGLFGKQYGIPRNKVFAILGATAFRMNKEGEMPSDASMVALIAVCNVYNLNPFVKEIYAYEDKQKNAIIPVVSVDGWIRLINSNPKMNGITFAYGTPVLAGARDGLRVDAFEWIECAIHRKDWAHPTVIREFLSEVYRTPAMMGGRSGPWQSHTNRMHRHKTLIQAGRVAFGFAGIYDEDEAQRILRSDDDDLPLTVGSPAVVEMPEELPASTIDAASRIDAVVDGTLKRADDAAVEAGKKMDAIAADIDEINRPKETVDPDTGEIVQAAVDPDTGEIVQAAVDPDTGEIVQADLLGDPPTPPKAAGAPLPPERRRMLDTQMSFKEIDDDALKAQFGIVADEVTTTTYPDVMNWIAKQS